MPRLTEAPPYSPIEAVTETLHGVPVSDPYRWLEDQDSQRTREWLCAQTRYSRAYLDSIPHRECIRARIRELLDIQTYDSPQKAGSRYFFRKRSPGQEQPSICFREGFDGEDQVLVDPLQRGTGPHAALRPLCISPDGRTLFYEVKQGGERTGTFEFLDIETRETLPDRLPRGYLRGFAFGADSRTFYYVHEPIIARTPQHHGAYRHVLGTNFSCDQEVFEAGESKNVRLVIVPGTSALGFLVVHFLEKTLTDFYLWSLQSADSAELVLRGAEYRFGPVLLGDGRILAITDRDAPNFRIVEVESCGNSECRFTDVVPHSGWPIQDWAAGRDRIYVSYLCRLETEIHIFDLCGKTLGKIPAQSGNSTRIIGSAKDGDELLFEQESFTCPVQIYSYSSAKSELTLWADRKIPFDSQRFNHVRVWFPAKDRTPIPMFLVGRHDVLQGGSHPTIMTSYGGYGVTMTPQFSAFVTFLLERGCLFALPNIRGGSEFGRGWHQAAKRRNRQVAFDDFLAAAEWLIETDRADRHRVAIFGGSNSGLLVGAAMTQCPDLFRAVVSIAPLLDMVRYHLFDGAHVWKDEFGTSDDKGDFAALLSYSPYHNVSAGIAYPATLIVSGDADQNCNPLHARKMTARLQAATISGRPVLLDYSRYRGHSPVLPLSERVEALTDRMAFLCDQLRLQI